MLLRRRVFIVMLFFGLLLFIGLWLHHYNAKLAVKRWHGARKQLLWVNTSDSIVKTVNKTLPVGNSTPAIKNQSIGIDSIANKTLKRKSDFQHAQDSYYGEGCKTNLYRSRLKIIFGVWKEIARRRNITQYFIAYGSFIGAVRNGDIVPYDSDIDVCIFRHEYHKLLPEESRRPLNLNDGTVHLLLQKHSPHPKHDTPRRDCKGNVVRSVTDDCAILDPHGRLYQSARIYMDIFVLEDFGRSVHDEYRNKILKRETLLPLRLCSFMGLRTYCPNDATQYLTTYYGGNYMKPHHICKGKKWVKNMPDARNRLI